MLMRGTERRTFAQINQEIESVGAANLKLMFDCYHVGRTEGDLITRLHDLSEAEMREALEELPDDLREQLGWIDKLVEVHNFPLLRVPGVEAGQLMRWAADTLVRAVRAGELPAIDPSPEPPGSPGSLL